MVPYKDLKNNSRLTDFEDLKDYVVRNTLKNIPRAIKAPDTGNSLLSEY